MLRPAGHGGIEGVLPGFFRHHRQGEHEVDVNIFKSGGAQNLDGLGNVFRFVLTAQKFEVADVEGLGAEADAVHSGEFPRFGFCLGDGGGVGFECEFFGVVRAQGFGDRGEEFGGKHGGRAAAEVDGLEVEFVPVTRAGQFLAHCGDVTPLESGTAAMHVEGAVGAHLRAEGNVEVEVLDCLRHLIGVYQKIAKSKVLTGVIRKKWKAMGAGLWNPHQYSAA